ncbi:hypothetical protein ABZ915_48435 [Streptomyces sp. NPDC046915]|uniref:hypothetical protein n=1 Tax=Streptomyces sp. NPDC046915 TaxID=3155257 RepID=UPI0033F694CA
MNHPAPPHKPRADFPHGPDTPLSTTEQQQATTNINKQLHQLRHTISRIQHINATLHTPLEEETEHLINQLLNTPSPNRATNR